MDDRMTLAALRVRAGYSQEEASGQIGVSKTTLAKWEQDSRLMPISRVGSFVQLYQIPESGIYFGDAAELSKKIRKAYELRNASDA